MIQDRKITTYQDNIASLSNRPSEDGLTPAQLKALFDGRTDKEVKDAINNIIDDLSATEDGASGADNIGVTTISGITGNTVQGVLEGLDAAKVTKIAGKQLSSEDYTTAEKSKLAGIAAGANNYSLPIASDSVLGGIKIGFGLEVLGDGTVNGTAAPAPDLIARQQIAALQDEMLTKANLSTLATAILLASAWVGVEAPYTQTVTVTGVTTSDMPDIAPMYSSNLETRQEQREAWNLVGDADSGEDTLTFICDEEKPTVDIPIQIRVVG